MLMFHVLRLEKPIVQYTFFGLMGLCCMRNVFYDCCVHIKCRLRVEYAIAICTRVLINNPYDPLFADGMNGIIVENNAFGSKTYTGRERDIIIHGTHEVSQKIAR